LIAPTPILTFAFLSANVLFSTGCDETLSAAKLEQTISRNLERIVMKASLAFNLSLWHTIFLAFYIPLLSFDKHLVAILRLSPTVLFILHWESNQWGLPRGINALLSLTKA
jgi:hypothetical protein